MKDILLTSTILIFVLTGIYFCFSSSFFSSSLFYISFLLLIIFSPKLISSYFSRQSVVPFIITMVFLAFVLNFLDAFYFDNYIYSQTHLLPEHIAIFTGLLISMTYTLQKPKKLTTSLLIILVICGFGFAGASISLAKATANLSLWIKSPDNISQRAIGNTYGNDMKFINYINKNTPESSSIVIPPISPGRRHTSNYWLMSSFLYPRQVISFQPGMDLSDYDYVLISSESEADYISVSPWPDFEIPKAKISLYSWETDSGLQVINADYIPNIISSNHPWGLLKVNK